MRVAFSLLSTSGAGLAAQVAHYLLGLVLDDNPVQQCLDDPARLIRNVADRLEPQGQIV